MNVMRFSTRQALREWRSGELTALAAALIISAAALVAVGTFTQRVEKGLQQGANELLGGDLVIRSRRVIDDDLAQEATRLGLNTAETVEFSSVGFSGDDSLLMQVKAVTDTYPLRGKMQVSTEQFGEVVAAPSGPPAGAVWVDPRILGQLETDVGEQLELGNSLLTISAVIIVEPDRAGSVFDLAPRVMMNWADLEPAGLLGVGSRVNYQLLVAGESERVLEFEDWFDSEPRPDARLRTLADSQRQVSGALDRAQRFLSLAVVTALILSGVAVVLSVRRFALRHLDTVAILRCLGARQNPTVMGFALTLFWIALPAIVIGSLLGYGAQSLLIWAVGDLVPEDLPQADFLPVWSAAITVMVSLIGFGLPPLLRLRQVPPVRVLNRQLGDPPASVWFSYGLPVVAMIGLVLWQARDIKLGLFAVGGLLATVLALTLSAVLLIFIARKVSRSSGIGWRFGIANVAKRGVSNALQMAGLGLGLMVMFLLGVVQSELLGSWSQSLPDEVPNYFLINVQPEQVADTEDYLQTQQLGSQGLFPMAVGKISEVNRSDQGNDQLRDPDASRWLSRTINLSWAVDLPRSNEVIAGEWWRPDSTEPEVSLAESWAESLQLSVGDRITFDIGAQLVNARVSSIRKVDWDSFDVNFFILLSPNSVGEVGRTYITSLYLPENRFSDLAELVKRYPNISVLNVGNVVERVKTIVDRVSLTVRFVFGFTLAAGIVVLIAALQSGVAERIYEGAVLRTLGALKKQLKASIIAEFSLIGGIAGMLAAIAAQLLGWAIADQVFELEYTANLWLLLVGFAVGAAATLITGLLGSSRVLKTPPAVVLREG